MPKVHLPDGKIVHFPDDMAPADIEKALGEITGGADFAARAAQMDPTDISVARSKNDAFGAFLREQAAAPKEGETEEQTFVRQYGKLSGPPQAVVQAVTAARGVDDLARAAASGMSFGLADELAAAASTATGVGGQEGGGPTYSDNLTAERTRDASASPYVRIPGEIAGALTTGVGAGRAGATLLNAAKPTVASMALRGAGEGAAYGGLHAFGSGEGGARSRLEDALYGSLIGAGTGGLTGAIAGRMARPKAPPVGDLRQQADAAYKAAERAGAVVTGSSFDDAVSRIAGKAVSKGIDKTIHPKATAALNRLIEAKGGDKSIQELELLRRVLKSAAASNEADERRIARIMIDKLDDYVENLKPADVVAGDVPGAVDALTTARGLWSRVRKGETIEGLIDRAKTRASQFSGSGYENALRTEFRSLAMNPKRLRGFTAEEQEAIRKVAEGGPVENILRFVGKFAPRGVVSTTLSGGAGFAAGGPLGSALLMGAGEAGRRGATAMTAGNARLASELARSGGKLPDPMALLPSRQRLFDALIAAGAQQGAGTLR